MNAHQLKRLNELNFASKRLGQTSKEAVQSKMALTDFLYSFSDDLVAAINLLPEVQKWWDENDCVSVRDGDGDEQNVWNDEPEFITKSKSIIKS